MLLIYRRSRGLLLSATKGISNKIHQRQKGSVFKLNQYRLVLVLYRSILIIDIDRTFRWSVRFEDTIPKFSSRLAFRVSAVFGWLTLKWFLVISFIVACKHRTWFGGPAYAPTDNDWFGNQTKGVTMWRLRVLDRSISCLISMCLGLEQTE